MSKWSDRLKDYSQENREKVIMVQLDTTGRTSWCVCENSVHTPVTQGEMPTRDTHYIARSVEAYDTQPVSNVRYSTKNGIKFLFEFSH